MQRVVIALAFVCLAHDALAQIPGGWPQWRGPQRDGAITSFGEPMAWPVRLTARWTVEVGEGTATPLVDGNRVYVFARHGDEEVMRALDAESGSIVWQERYPTASATNASAHQSGPSSTPVLSTGRIYAVGATGTITCFDAETGKAIWQRESAAPQAIAGHSFSPLVDRGLLITQSSEDPHTISALDIVSGTIRWSWSGDAPLTGSPLLGEIDSTRQVIAVTQNTIAGIAISSGERLWQGSYTEARTTNSVIPILSGDRLIISGRDIPVTAFTMSRPAGMWRIDTRWNNDAFCDSDALADSATLFCLSVTHGRYIGVDIGSGETIWVSDARRAAQAMMSRSGNLLFSLETDGDLFVARISRTGLEPLRTYRVSDSGAGTPPVIVGDRIFVKAKSTLTLWTVD